jgi:membrane associated rhomboid family serine protease
VARDSDEKVAPATARQQTISLTTALMALNGVMFLLVGLRGGVDPSVPMLIDWGANFGPLTVNGQWWRLLTATVLHANVLHLLSNLYALWYVGRLAEPLFGRPSFLLIYLLSGVAGCVSSLWWHPFLLASVHREPFSASMGRSQPGWPFAIARCVPRPRRLSSAASAR